MKRGITGKYETTSTGGEQVKAFIPYPLPPKPVLDFAVLQTPLESASVALGRLDCLAVLLPNPHFLLYTYTRKEAVLSSQIEGTQSSLSDFLRFELAIAPSVPFGDVIEVSNYVAAMTHGLRRTREGLPICNRLFREVHAALLSRGRGSDKAPGEFRHSQNWIGGTRPGNARFVPPPANQVYDCMSDLEKFVHADNLNFPALIRAGLAHAQFETIHPFLDGNGRIGRLLITFMLCDYGILREPLLYLSLYLKQHRDEYYSFLNEVRHSGNWEAWLMFFLEGVTQTAEAAVSTARNIQTLFEKDEKQIYESGRVAISASRIHHSLKERPIATLGGLVDQTGLSFTAVNNGMKALERLGIARELTGMKRNRLFCYDAYIDTLNEGTELE